MPDNIKIAFIFDMDGTMIDSMPFHNRSWLALFADLGYEVDPEEFSTKTYGMTTKDVIKMILGESITAEESAKYSDMKEFLYRVQYRPHIKPVEGLMKFLADAKARQIPMALATSAGAANIRFVLSCLKLEDTFDCIVGADDVTHGKPDPEMFLLAARKLGAQPAQCIVFEDAMAGVEAARRAGMRAVAVTTTHDATEFKNKNEVIRIIDDFVSLDIDSL